ncbi:MAG: hypothetical protein H0W23_06470, partial [Chloroflexia bacterium]|nr:hypothetical protein [Chloroflexia bacterium]
MSSSHHHSAFTPIRVGSRALVVIALLLTSSVSAAFAQGDATPEPDA